MNLWSLFLYFSIEFSEISMRNLVLCFLLILTSLTWAKHPTHLSVVNMEVRPEPPSIEYSLRIFQDDINFLITNLYHDELFHSTKEFDIAKNTQKLDNYFMQAVEVSVNGNTLKPILIKKESNEIEYWLFFSVPLQSIPLQLNIKNKILTEYHTDQTNLLIFSYKEQEKGLTFTTDHTNEIITLDNK